MLLLGCALLLTERARLQLLHLPGGCALRGVLLGHSAQLQTLVQLLRPLLQIQLRPCRVHSDHSSPLGGGPRRTWVLHGIRRAHSLRDLDLDGLAGGGCHLDPNHAEQRVRELAELLLDFRGSDGRRFLAEGGRKNPVLGAAWQLVELPAQLGQKLCRRALQSAQHGWRQSVERHLQVRAGRLPCRQSAEA